MKKKEEISVALVCTVPATLRFCSKRRRLLGTMQSNLVNSKLCSLKFLQPQQRTVVDESGMIRSQMGSTVEQ
jgi:hypothetical protein